MLVAEFKMSVATNTLYHTVQNHMIPSFEKHPVRKPEKLKVSLSEFLVRNVNCLYYKTNLLPEGITAISVKNIVHDRRPDHWLRISSYN